MRGRPINHCNSEALFREGQRLSGLQETCATFARVPLCRARSLPALRNLSRAIRFLEALESIVEGRSR